LVPPRAGREDALFATALILALQAAPDARTATLDALAWLARHQDPDGSWSVTTYTARCREAVPCGPNPGDEDFKTGVTGLALLAFLGAGYTHLSKEIHDGIVLGDPVRKGLNGLLKIQAIDGFLGDRGLQKAMYGHAIATLALAEDLGSTRSALIRDQAQKAVDALLAAQNPGKGWRYRARGGDNDTSVTAWAVLALQSAGIAGLAVPPGSLRGAVAWIDEATDENGRTGYTRKGTGKVFIPGLCESYDHHETLSAVALFARIGVERNWKDVRHEQALRLLAQDLPTKNPLAADACYWFFASHAVRRYQGETGETWTAWKKALLDLLLPVQNRAGEKKGSWEPVDRWSGEGGRVYITAMNALTLNALSR
jgi:hypothetical protein